MFDLKGKLIAGLVVLFGIAVLISILLYRARLETQIKVDTSRDSVIKEIQELGNLETASYSIEKVVEAGENKNAFQNLLFGDRILLIAHGKIVAGVDLSQLTDKDIKVKGTELTITLPPPTILLSTLDNSKTSVYDRTKGVLNPGASNLESEARAQALTSITQAACDGGILEEARQNAINRVRQLFEFAGFTMVTVYMPEGTC